MTDEERTALKFEIVAELVHHLEDNYVKKADMEVAAKSLTAIIAKPLGDLLGALEYRVDDIEMTVALTDVHQGTSPSFTWWREVNALKRSYALNIRKRVASWIVEYDERLRTELDEASLTTIRRLVEVLGRDED